MPRMKIFNQTEQQVFDNPPIFNSLDRKKFFKLPMGVVDIIETFKNPTNKVCFLVVFGYFKATRKFFAKKFHQNDIIFVANKLGLTPIKNLHIQVKKLKFQPIIY